MLIEDMFLFVGLLQLVVAFLLVIPIAQPVGLALLYSFYLIGMSFIIAESRRHDEEISWGLKTI